MLLEFRTLGCGIHPGLWGIPGGAGESSETSDSAASREPQDAEGARPDRRFFAAGDIPEETSLDAMLAIAPVLSQQRLCDADVTDRIFSALFYSHLWPILAKTWPATGADTCLLWTIGNIPFRKFKSAVPFLLTRSHPCALVPALAAELMFALFYLLDDLIDSRTHRYGRATAFGARGSAQIATAIMIGLTQIDEWLVSMHASNNVRQAVKEGARALADEQVVRRGSGSGNLGDYAEHSMRRTRFLGDLWTIACEESGCDAEAALIRRTYGACALAGQIKNDLRDIRTTEREERFRDIKDGVRNACVLRLLEIGHESECEWLTTRLVAGGAVTAEDEGELTRLFSKHEVDRWARTQVQELSEQVLASIAAAADVSDARRVVLSEWVALQFTRGLDSVSDHSPTRVARLLEAVAELTERL